MWLELNDSGDQSFIVIAINIRDIAIRWYTITLSNHLSILYYTEIVKDYGCMTKISTVIEKQMCGVYAIRAFRCCINECLLVAIIMTDTACLFYR